MREDAAREFCGYSDSHGNAGQIATVSVRMRRPAGTGKDNGCVIAQARHRADQLSFSSIAPVRYAIGKREHRRNSPGSRRRNDINGRRRTALLQRPERRCGHDRFTRIIGTECQDACDIYSLCQERLSRSRRFSAAIRTSSTAGNSSPGTSQFPAPFFPIIPPAA